MRPLANKSEPENAPKYAENPAGFTPLLALESRKSDGNSEAGKASKEATVTCEKDVELVVEQGVVRKIRVQCSCGEIIEINCRYPEG